MKWLIALLVLLVSLTPGVATAAFPNIEATATTAGSTSTTSHVLTLPAGVSAGDCLLVGMSGDTSGFVRTSTWPGSWVELIDAQDAGNNGYLTVGFLRASGGETSVTVTSSGSFRHSAVAYRISGCHGTTNPEAGTPSSGASGNPNPPSLNPAGWDVEDTLWLTVVGTSNNGGNPHQCSTNYGSEVHSTDSVPTTTSSACHRNLAAASDDPDNAIESLAAAWVATTLAVRPVAVVGGAKGSMMTQGCCD